MPIHDWTRVDAGHFFNAFRNDWLVTLSRALNREVLSREHYSLIGITSYRRPPEIPSLDKSSRASRRRWVDRQPPDQKQELSADELPPKATYQLPGPPSWVPERRSSVTIRNVVEDRLVAVIDFVAPENKRNQSVLDAYIEQVRDLLSSDVHVLLVDLFPPGRHDPKGIHAAVWGDDDTAAFPFDQARPLTCASYQAGYHSRAFIEPVAVGDELPGLPLFLSLSTYIVAPLESSYREAFASLPEYVQGEVTGE